MCIKGVGWNAVNRIFVYPRAEARIENIKDLRGKTVASPFGSIAHREAFLEQQAAGVDPEKDVENQNMDISSEERGLGRGRLGEQKPDTTVVSSFLLYTLKMHSPEDGGDEATNSVEIVYP
jgi:hypothetical protein